MNIFSSKRESRLWLGMIIVLAGIYASLGQAPAIAAMLRENNNLRDTMFFVLFVSSVIVAVLFIRRRPGYAEIAVGVGILIIYLTAWLRIGTLEERTHLFEYGLVAAFVHEALLERRESGRQVPTPAVLALLISIVFGWFDEAIQFFLPNRVFDVRDVMFNTFAASMIIGARWILALVRERVQSR